MRTINASRRDLEDEAALAAIGIGELNLAIQATRPQQRGVQRVGAIRCHDHLLPRVALERFVRIEEQTRAQQIMMHSEQTLTFVFWSKPSIWLRSSSRMRCTSRSAPVCESKLDNSKQADQTSCNKNRTWRKEI